MRPEDAQCGLTVRPFGLLCIMYVHVCVIRSPELNGDRQLAATFIFNERPKRKRRSKKERQAMPQLD